MNDKIAYTIIGILFLAVLGLGVWTMQEGASPTPSPTPTTIQTAKINIDENEVAQLQKAVNNGHQPWRTDPLMTAEAEAGLYGFKGTDEFTLNSQTQSAGTAQVEAIHNNQKYLIKLIQPVPGQAQIWTIYSIKKM